MRFVINAIRSHNNIFIYLSFNNKEELIGAYAEALDDEKKFLKTFTVPLNPIIRVKPGIPI